MVDISDILLYIKIMQYEPVFKYTVPAIATGKCYRNESTGSAFV